MSEDKSTKFNLKADSKLTDFIKEYDNCIEASLIDEILTEYNSDKSEFNKSLIYDNNNSINSTFRSSESINISHPEIISKNSLVRKKIDEKLYNILSKLVSEYVTTTLPTANINTDSGYELLVYKQGTYFRQHIDTISLNEITPITLIKHGENLKSFFRQISVSIQLNDNYEGGELTFFDDTYRIKKKKGLVTFFPSNFLFPHQVTDVTKGTRFSIVTWFSSLS